MIKNFYIVTLYRIQNTNFLRLNMFDLTALTPLIVNVGKHKNKINKNKF